MKAIEFEREWHSRSKVRPYFYWKPIMVMGINFANGEIAFDVLWFRIWLHYKWFKLIN